MKNNKLFLGLPHDIMNTKNDLHYEMLNFKTNIEMKVFIVLLAKATMIFKTNKQVGIQTFSTVGFFGAKGLLPKSINLEELTQIIENMRTPFFDHLSINNKTISFELSKPYKISSLKSGFSKIDLEKLKSHRDLKTTKLALLTTAKPKGYLSLNYLSKALGVNPDISRNVKIREIKRAFTKLEKNGVEWNYKHPANQNAEVLKSHYKFHYKTIKPEIFNPDDLNDIL